MSTNIDRNRITGRRFLGHATVAIALALILFGGAARAAQTGTWSGASDANWATLTNWNVTPVPGVGDTALFNNTSAQTTISTGSIFLSTFTFDTASVAAYTLGGATAHSGAVTLPDGTVTVISLTNTIGNNQTLNCDLTLGTAIAGNSTISNASAKTLTIAGNITGGLGGTAAAKTLTLTGAGPIVLSGAVTKGSASTLVLQENNTGTTTVSNAGTLFTQINFNGGGSTTVLDIGAGSLRVNNGGGATIQTQGTTNATINASGGGTWALQVSDGDSGAANGTTLTVNAQITGAFRYENFVVANGTGVTVLANANNSFTGGLLMSSSVVSVAGIGNTGANSYLGTGNTLSLGGGILKYTGPGEVTNKILNLSGTTTAATLDNSGTGTGTLEFSSAAAIAAGLGIKTWTLQGSTSNIGQIDGIIADNSGTNKTSLNKAGTGTWILKGANTYTGTTTVNGGVLQIITSPAAAAIGTITVNGSTTTPGTLASAAAISVSLPAPVVLAPNTGTTFAQGPVLNPGTVGTAGTITLTNAAALTTNALSNLNFDLANATTVGGGVNDLIAITTAAPPAINGLTQININALATLTTGNLYTLINGYTGTLSTASMSNLVMNPIISGDATHSAVLQNTSGALKLLITAAAPPPSTAYWSGSTDTNWNTSAAGTGVTNWRTDATSNTNTFAIPFSNTDVHFVTTNPTAANLATTITGTGINVKSLTFDSTVSVPVSIAGPGTLGVNSVVGITMNSSTGGAATISAPITVGAAQTWSNNDLTDSLTISGNISNVTNTLTISGVGATIINGIIGNGSGNLTKTGVGILTLGAANTYTGNTLIDNGTVRYTVDNLAVKALQFGAANGSSNVGTLDLSTTPTNLTATALSVVTNSALTNTITVGSGKTLTVSGNVTIGYDLGTGVAATLTETNTLTIAGAGSVSFPSAAATVNIGVSQGTQLNAPTTSTLDLTGLTGATAFSTNCTTFNVAFGQTAAGTLKLSNTANTIAATSMQVGHSNGLNGGTGLVVLGTGTNNLFADTFNIGFSKVNGTIQFASQTLASPGTVTFANKLGTGPIATLVLGSNNGTGTAGTPQGALDLRGHNSTINATTVTMGITNQTSTGYATGAILFDTGTFTTQTLNLGQKSSTGSGSPGSVAGTNTVTLGGGTFNASVSTIMSANTSTGTGTLLSNIVVNGGAYTTGSVSGAASSGASAVASATSTITVNGGTFSTVTYLGAVKTAANTGIDTANITVTGGSFTVTGAAFQLASLAATGVGQATGTVTISGGALNTFTDILLGGVASSTPPSIVLSGGTLNLNSSGTNKTIGTASLPITMNLQSGTLNSSGQINGGAAIAKTTIGTLTLSGVNTFTSPFNVNAGTLLIASASSAISPIVVNGSATPGTLSGTGTLTGGVTLTTSTATTFAQGPVLNPGAVGSAGTLTLATGILTTNALSNLTFDLAASAQTVGAGTNDLLVTDAPPVINAATQVNINVLGGTLTSGTVYTLINGYTGTLNGTSFNNLSLNPVFTGDATHSGILMNTNGALQLLIVAAAPATAFWSGAVDSNWNSYNVGTGATNWRTSATSGVDTLSLPASSTDVHFYTTSPSAINLNTALLGSSLSIKTLTFDSTVTSAVTVAGPGTLLLNATAGIAVSSTATGQITISAPINFVASQTWTLANTINPLIINGAVGGVGSLTKSGAGTLVFGGANNYSGSTLLDGGTVRYTADNLNLGLLQFGAVANSANLTTVDASTTPISLTATSLSVLTSTATAGVNVLNVGIGKTFTVNGNVTVGPPAPAATNPVKLTIGGGGAFAVAATGGTFQVGGSTTGTTGAAGDTVTLDLTGLASTTINLGATGTIRINNPQGGNTSAVQSTMLCPLPVVADNTIPTCAFTALNFNVGDNGAFNGIATQINAVLLGTGLTTMNVNTINVGTGGRDIGSMTFNAGTTTGAIKVRAADGVSRAVFNIATGGTATASTGASNLVDFTGHSADLLLTSLNVGNQARVGNLSSDFRFDTGTLDATAVTIGYANAGNAVGTVNTLTYNLNLGGGTVTVGTGAVTMGVANDTSTGVKNIVGNLNISVGTVNIGTTGLYSISLGNNTGGIGVSVIDSVNITGGTVTLAGDIIAGGLVRTTSTVTLNGGTLDMTNHNIGTAASGVVLNAQSGTLKNILELSNGVALTKTTTGTLTLSGVNSYTAGTAVNGGTLVLNPATPTGSAAGGGRITVNGSSTPGALTGTGVVTGGVTLATGTAISPGQGPVLNPGSIGGVGTLTINSTLITNTFSNLSFDLNTANTVGGTTNDLISTPALPVINGPTQINITALTPLTTGLTYTLISGYSGTIANFSALSLNPLIVGDTLHSGILLNANGSLLLQVVDSNFPIAYWSGKVDGIWNTSNAGVQPTNWNTDATSNVDLNGLPGASTDAHFVTTTPTAAHLSTTLGTNFALKTLTFDSSVSVPVSVNGSNVLTLAPATSSSGLTVNSAAGGAVTLGTSLTLNVNQTWTNNNTTNPLVVSGNVFGSSNLTLAGPGQIVLSGTNTASGTLTVSSTANVQSANVGTTGSGLGGFSAINIASGGTLDLNAGTTASATSPTSLVTINGTGNAGSLGALMNSNATGDINALHNLTLGSNATIGGVGQFGLSLGTTPTLALSNFTLTSNAASFVLSGATVTATAGATGITIPTGSVSLQNTTTVSATANQITVNGIGVLDMNALTNATNAAWTLNFTSGTPGWSASGGVGGTNIWGGPIVLGTTANIKPNGFFIQANGVISGSGGLAISGGGTFILGGSTNTFQGNITVDASTLQVTSGSNGTATNGPYGYANIGGTAFKTITLTNNAVYRSMASYNTNVPTAALPGNGVIFIIGTGGATFDTPTGTTLILDDGTGNGTATGNSDLQGFGTLTKTGPGILSLGNGTSNFNVFTGAIVISAGTLQHTGASTGSNALGDTLAGTTILTGAQYNLNGTAWPTPEPLALNGFGPTVGGALTNLSTTAATFNGPITIASNASIGNGSSGGVTLSATATIDLGLNILTFNNISTGRIFATGVVSGAGSVLVNATVAGTGEFVPFALNTYTGGTTLNVNSFTAVAISSTGPAGSPTNGPFGQGSTPLILAGGQVRSGISGPFTVGNTVNMTANTTFYTVATEKSLFFSGPMTLMNGTRTITSTVGLTVPGTTVEFDGIIDDGGFGNGLIKAGAGNLTLGGVNTYTGGTVVNAGALNVTGTLAQNTALTITGATFSIVGGGANPLPRVSLLTITGPAALGFDIGADNSTSDSITTQNLATTSGAITINIESLPGFGTSSSYVLLSSPNGGLTSGGATYALGSVPGGFAYSLVPTDTLLTLNVTPVAPISTIYWRGNLNNSWASYNGSGLTNWFSDLSGTTNALSGPGTGSFVIFSTTNATGPTLNSSVDKNYTVKGIEFSSNPSGVTNVNVAAGLNGAQLPGQITLAPTPSGVGIAVDANAGVVTCSANLVIAAPQTWTVDGTGANGSSLALNGTILGTNANPLTITGGGTGVVAFGASAGVSTYSGATTVASGGILQGNTTGTFSMNSPMSVTGTGVLRLNGVNNTLPSLFGNGTVVNNHAVTAATLTIGDSTSSTFSGSLQNGGVATLGLTKVGTGALTLSGLNTLTGNTTVNAGTLNITGTLTGNTTTSTLAYGNAVGNAVVNVSGNMTLFATTGGNIAGGVGIYNQTGGLVTVSPGTGNSQFVTRLAGSYGYFNLTGGTYKDVNRFDIVATNNYASPAYGVLFVGGTGILDHTNAEWFINGYSFGEMTVADNGLIDHSGASAPLAIIMDTNAVGGSYGILNIAGGTVMTTTQPLRLGNSTNAGAGNGNTAFINLAGGTLGVGTGISVSLPTPGGNNAFVNFAGGTLLSTGNVTNWIPLSSGAITFASTIFGPINNSAVAGAPSFAGGMIVNTNGFSSSLNNPLLAASGCGVTQGDMTVSGGTGYVGAPLVQFSTSGVVAGGTPAAGYALINNGVLSGIVITCPGTYTAGTVPTVSLFGGGGTGASVTCGALNTPNSTSGAFTKNGAGTMTLSGANTFVAGVTINQGTLALGATGTIPSANSVNANSGTLDMTTFNDTISGIIMQGNGAINGTTGILTSLSNFDLRYGIASAILDGSVGVNKTTTDPVTLSGVNTFSGSVTIANGPLLFSQSANLGNASATNTISIFSGGTLSYTGTTAQALAANQVVSVTVNGTLNASNSTGVLTIPSPVIINGTLTKTGPGTIVLADPTNGGAATVVVNSGVLQAGFASINKLTVGSTGIMNFNNANLQTITLQSTAGSLTLSGGAQMSFELSASGSNDKIVIPSNGGTAIPSVGSGTIMLNFINSGIPAGGGSYVLISAPDGGLKLPNNTTYVLGTAPNGYNYTITATDNQVSVDVNPFSPVYWGGGLDFSWSTTSGPTSNWFTDVNGTINFGTVPGATHTAVFSTVNAPTTIPTTGTTIDTTLNAAFTLDSIQAVANPPGITAVSINAGAGGTLKLAPVSSSGGIFVQSNAGTLSIGAPLNIFTNQTWNVDGTGANGSALAINANTVFTANITKTGAGALTLSGNNSGSGAINLSAGTLNVNSASALGTGVLTIGGGTILDNTSIGSIALTTNTIQNWNGSFTFAGTRSLDLGSGSVSIGNSLTLTTNGISTLTVRGAVDDFGALRSLTKAGTGTLVLSGNTIFGGLLSMTGGVLTLNGTNIGAGGTTLTAGTLNLGNAGALGSGTFTINGGTFDNTSGNAFSLSGNNPVILGGNSTFTGTNDVNFGSGSVSISAPSTLTVAAKSLTIPGSISGASSWVKDGVGTLNLTGNSTFLGSMTVARGTLNLTGSETGGGNIVVSSLAGNATLNIPTGAAYTGVGSSTLTTGIVTGSNGAVYINGGTLTMTQPEITDNVAFGAGDGGYGYFSLSGGGTFSQSRFMFGGTGATTAVQTGIGVGLITSGTVNNNGYLILGRAGNAIGQLTMTGGTLNHTAASQNIYVGFGNTSRGELTQTGGLIDATGRSVSIGTAGFGTAVGATGNFNLNGGTLVANSIVQAGSTLAVANFSGGTFKVSATGTIINPTSALFATYVNGPFGTNSGGITIDTNNLASTIASNLLAPTGNGVVTIPVSTGSGYIGAPYVQVTGDGTGATGYATVDPITGSVTGIVITNPGVNYTTASATLTGGGGTGATAGTAVLAPNTSSGLTKLGLGILTMTGANTYTGATAIANGSLQLGAAGTTGSLLGTGGAISIASGSTLIISRTNAVAQGTDFSSLAITGQGGFTQASTGTTTLTATNTFSGPTAITAGALSLGSAGTTGSIPSSSSLALTAGTLIINHSNAMVQGVDFPAAPLTGAGAFSQLGTGTTTLNAANTYTGNTTVNGGVLNMTGSLIGNGTAAAGSTLTFGGAAGNSTINISGNITNYYTFNGATVAGSNAVYNQTGGLVNFTTTAIANATNLLCTNGYAYMNITGGKTTALGRFAPSNGASSTGVMYIGGTGTLDTSAGEWFLMAYSAAGNGGISEITVGPGGSLLHAGASANFGLNMDRANGYAVLNITGGLVTTSTTTITFGNGAASAAIIGTRGILNLDSGMLTAGKPIAVANTASAAGGNLSNFNCVGGTIQANATIAGLFPATQTYNTYATTIFGSINNSAVAGGTQNFNGGLTIDTNGFAVSNATPLVSATGFGVTQANLTITPGSGYIGAPAVQFSAGASGLPATGYALMNADKVAGIVITSPGTYPAGTTPTVTLTGGGATTAATVTSSVLATALPNDGGLTKIGANVLTLTGASTYVGPTAINGGTLNAGVVEVAGTSGPFGKSAAANPGSISFGGGTLQFSAANTNDYSGRFSTVAGQPFSIDTNAVNVTFATPLSSSTGTLTKLGTGTLTLTTANTFSGITTITAGTLQLGNAGATGTLNSAGSIAINGTLLFNHTNPIVQGTDFGTIASGTGLLTQSGTGSATLNTVNTFSGTTTVSAGAGPLIVTNSGALGTSTVSLPKTSTATGVLQLMNGITLNNTFAGFGSSNNFSDGGAANIENLSGSNTVTGDMTIAGAGGNGVNIQSDSGLLTLSGTLSNNVASSARTFDFGGAGNGIFSGQINNGSNAGAVTPIVKEGTGTWTFSGTNSNTTGGVNLLSGVLNIASLANTGINSALGAGGTITLSGQNTSGTLQYTGSTAQSTDRIVTVAATGGSIDASGTGSGTLAFTGLFAAADPVAFNLNYTNGSNQAINTTSNSPGIVAGMTVTSGAVPAGTTIVSVNGNVYTLSANSISTAVVSTTFSTSSRTLTLKGSNTGSNTIASALADSSGGGVLLLSKSGTGTWVLTANNTYTGTTTINAPGTLQIGAGGTTGSLSLSSTITDNGTLTFNRSNDVIQGVDFKSTGISGSGSLIQAGSAALTLNGANFYTNGTILQSGQLNINNSSAIGSGALTILGGNIDNTSAGDITLSTNNAQNWNTDFTYVGSVHNLNMGTGAVAINSNRVLTVAANTFTIGGAVSDGGNTFGLTKIGAGSLVLAGGSTYTGVTNLNAGILNAGGAESVGTSGPLGKSAASNPGSIVFGGGTLQYSVANNADYSGRFSVGNNQAYNVDTNGRTVNWATALVSVGGNLSKLGSGTLTLSGANVYTGVTTINAGVLQANNATALGNGGGIRFTGGALQYTNQSNSQDWSTRFVNSTTAPINLDSNGLPVTLAGTIDFTNTNGVQLNDTNATPGTLTLSGNNSYTGGTTVTRGTLSVSADANLGGTGGVNLNGGTLRASASFSSGRSVALNANSVIDVSSGQTLSVTGTVSGTTANLSKTGTGALSMGGTSGYAGTTTVTGGDLRGTGTLSASTVITSDAANASVWPGAALRGTDVPINGETLTVAGLNLSGGTGGKLKIALNSSSPNSTQQLVVTGNVCTLTNGTLSLGIQLGTTFGNYTVLTSTANAISTTFGNIKLNGVDLGANPTSPVSVEYQSGVVIVHVTNPVVSPVKVDSFAAKQEGNGVLLSWNCVSEYQNIGFNVYRRAAKDGEWDKVNPVLISGRITNPDAKTYSLYDWTEVGQFEYKLESLSVLGETEMYPTIAQVSIDAIEADTTGALSSEGVAAAVASVVASESAATIQALSSKFAGNKNRASETDPTTLMDRSALVRNADQTLVLAAKIAVVTNRLKPAVITNGSATSASAKQMNGTPFTSSMTASRSLLASRWFTGSSVATSSSFTGAKVLYTTPGVLKIPLSSIPAGMNANRLVIQREGRTIPALAVTPEALLVYGQGYQDEYTDKDALFLRNTSGATAAGSVTQATGLFASAQNVNTQTSAVVTTDFHDQYFDFTVNAYRPYNYPPWFSGNFLSASDSAGTNWSFPIVTPNASGGAATLTINVWSLTQSTDVTPDHALQVLVNGTPVGQASWSGGGKMLQLTMQVPSSVLNAGNNTVNLVTPPIVGVVSQTALLHSMSVAYTRQLDGSKPFSLYNSSGTSQLYELSNLPSADAWVVDARFPDRAALVPYESKAQSDGTFKIRFNANSGGTGQFQVVPTGMENAPFAVTKRLVKPLKNTNSYLAVGPAQFSAGTQPLVMQRSKEGLRAQFVDQEQVFDYYNYGRYGPSGIQKAVQSTRPQYLLLVGRTIYDYRNYEGQNIDPLCPTFLVSTTFWSQATSDSLFGDLGRGYSEVAVGRLPITTTDELSITVKRILSNSGAPRSGIRVHALADTADPSTADFPAQSTAVSQLFPDITWQPNYFGVTYQSLQDVQNALTTAADGGADWILYVGHGNAARLGKANPKILDTDLVQAWTGNVVLLQSTCTANWIAKNVYDYKSIAIQAMTQPQGGISASIGTSTYMNSDVGTEFLSQLMKNADQGGMRWGTVLMKTQQWSAAKSGAFYSDLNRTELLLGDPGMPVFAPAGKQSSANPAKATQAVVPPVVPGTF